MTSERAVGIVIETVNMVTHLSRMESDDILTLPVLELLLARDYAMSKLTTLLLFTTLYMCIVHVHILT